MPRDLAARRLQQPSRSIRPTPPPSWRRLSPRACVVSPGVGTPTGAVTFKDGAITLGAGALSIVAGQNQVTFTMSSLSVGGHSITAVYSGDTNFVTSTSSALTQTVNQANTTTIVTS